MGKRLSFAGVFLLACLVSACASNRQHEMYYWGHYEQLIYNDYVAPGSADPQMQITMLNEDIQKAEAQGKRIAPGVYAQLGMLYALMGNVAESKAAFLEERQLYPESRILIDGMLERARKNEAGL